MNPERWEDQEHPELPNDIEEIRKAFRKRLYRNEEAMTEQMDIESLENLASQLKEAHEDVNSQIEAKRLEQLLDLDVSDLDVSDFRWTVHREYGGVPTLYGHSFSEKAHNWARSNWPRSREDWLVPPAFLDERGLGRSGMSVGYDSGGHSYVRLIGNYAAAFQKLVADIQNAQVWKDSKEVEKTLMGILESAEDRVKTAQAEVGFHRQTLEILEVLEPPKPPTWEVFRKSLVQNQTQPLPDKLDFGGGGDEGTWRLLKGIVGGQRLGERFVVGCSKPRPLQDAKNELKVWASESGEWPIALYREEKGAYAKLVWDARNETESV